MQEGMKEEEGEEGLHIEGHSTSAGRKSISASPAKNMRGTFMR